MHTKPLLVPAVHCRCAAHSVSTCSFFCCSLALRARRCCRSVHAGDWTAGGDLEPWDDYRMMEGEEEPEEPEPESEQIQFDANDEPDGEPPGQAEKRSTNADAVACRPSSTFLASRRFMSSAQFDEVGRAYTHTQLEAMRQSDTFLAW